MRLLLDTHAFLWFVTADPKLSTTAEQAIRQGSNEVLLSTASIWEIAIKVSIGRLPMPLALDVFITNHLTMNRIAVLAFDLPQILTVANLPLHHRDPFDRMLVAQAQSESLPIVSADIAFDAYGVNRLW